MKTNLKLAPVTTRQDAVKADQAKARPVVDMLTGEGTGLYISVSDK